MPKHSTKFVSRCRVCGRTLEIPVTLLGKLASCNHCRATFIALDRPNDGLKVNDPATEIVRRLDLILSTVECQRTHNRDSSDEYERRPDETEREREELTSAKPCAW